MSSKFIFPFLVALLLAACVPTAQDTSATAPTKKEVFLPTALEAVYSQIRPKVQTFTVDNTVPAKVVADKGTEVFIPENSFIDQNGKPVTGPVEVEIVEAFDLSDFLTSGLATMSDGKLLISNGMMNIEAKADGVPVKLKESASLAISMPTIRPPKGFQMFTGDGRNWTVDNTMQEADYLVPLPLEVLYPEDVLEVPFLDKVILEETCFDTTILNFTDSKYENTLISTNEFKDRINFLHKMTLVMNCLDRKEAYFNEGNFCEKPLGYDIWKIYFDGLDKPIEVLDSLAKRLFFEFCQANEKELTRFLNRFHKYVRKKGSFALLYVISYWIEEDYDKFMEYFPSESKGKVKPYNNHGVDLNAGTASEQLAALGLSPQEISELLELHFKREAIIQSIQRQQEAVEHRETVSKLYQSTVFSTDKLGWINCDRFLKDPDAAKADILVSNASTYSLGFIDCSLVIPSINARLSGFPRGVKDYAFTQKEGVYTKLPIGMDAVVVGVAYQHGNIFYAAQRIKIEDGLKVDLDMKQVTVEELKALLEETLAQPT